MKTEYLRPIIDKFMNKQTADYFQGLASSKSPRSLQLSLSSTETRLLKLINEIEQPTNPESDRSSPIGSKLRLIASTIGKKNGTLAKNISEFGQSLKSLEKSKPNRNSLMQTRGIREKLGDELQRLKRIRQIDEIKLQETGSNLQRLKLQTEIAMSLRREQQIHKEIRETDEQNQKKHENEEKQKEANEGRKILILHRLQKLEQSRQQRQEILSAKNLQIVPKYKLMEKQFLMQEIKKEIEFKLLLKRQKDRKAKGAIPPILKELSTSRAHTKPKRTKAIKTEVTESVQETNRQNWLKRKEMAELLDQRRRHKKVNISAEKEKEIEMLKDKFNNPFKYNFLRAKNLTDEQIYTEFKDFEFNFDKKALGDEYLEESKLLIKKKLQNDAQLDQSVLNSSGKQSKTHNIQSLPKRKTIKTENGQPQHSQTASHVNPVAIISQNERDARHLQQLLKQSQSKSKIVQLLDRESERKQKQLKLQTHELSKPKAYEELLKIQNNMDGDYLHFLKAKIISLQLHIQP